MAVPWPGDWHILLNYQKALMKAYAGAGLTKLGEITQHRSETLTSLIQCTNFRRTHNFLVQTMEAFYCFFLSLYMNTSNSSGTTTVSNIQRVLTELVTKFNSVSGDHDLDTIKSDIQRVYLSLAYALKNLQIHGGVVTKAGYNPVLVSVCINWDGLFVAIRYRNWDLCNSSIKLLAPVFSAFDRPIYQSLIPRHIFDVLTLPNGVHTHLKGRCFFVCLSSSEWHAVALDKCHKMKINKDAKMAITQPSVHIIEHISNYLPFRAACVNNLSHQLFPERELRTLKFSHAPTSMVAAISNHGLFHNTEENSGFWNFLESQKGSAEQAHDHFNFREIGQVGYESFILTKLLKSTATPVRRKRLNTFTVSQAKKCRVKQVDREAKITLKRL